jgi:muramoyltetrapeptide carboxypeptidase
MTLMKPKALKTGDTIGFCAPAYYMLPDDIEECAQNIEKLGFRVHIHPQCYVNDAWLGGTIEQRVNALHDLFTDPKIDAIVLTSGGYGCMQLLEHLNFDLIKRHPKIIIGYSDLTVLLAAIQRHCGFVTYHGPNARRFLDEVKDEKTTNSFLSVLTGEKPVYDYTGEHENDPIVVNPGTISAPLNGGNHVLLSYMVGTHNLPDFSNTLYFTESNQPLFTDVDMALYQLRLSGRINNIRGLILGRMIGHHYRIERLSYIRLNMTFENIAKSHFPDIPVITNFPCGHEETILTFPLTIPFKLDAREDGTVRLEQLEEAVSL